MLVSVELKNFRQHKNLTVKFTNGLQLLRGANEAGKSSVIEAVLYALYGTKSLRGTLGDTATWGCKEGELKAKLVVNLDRTLYTFTRSKGGAEVVMDGKVLVTGQNEVSAFAAQLLGADAKTASVLMMADQSGLRGALDDGPTAVSGLMSKLADFDLVDRIIGAMHEKLLLGSEAPIREKLEAAEAELLTAQKEMPPVPSELPRITSRIAELTKKIEVANKAYEKMHAPVYNSALAKLSEAEEKIEARNQAETDVKTFKAASAKAESELQEAKTRADFPVDLIRIDNLRREIDGAGQRAALLAAYQDFLAIPIYPTVHWKGAQEAFEEAVSRLENRMRPLERLIADSHAEAKMLEKNLIVGGICPTCGTDVSKREDIIAKNEATQQKIAAINTRIEPAEKMRKHYEAMQAHMGLVRQQALHRETLTRQISGHLEFDLNFYPPKISWKGDAPPSNNLDIRQLKEELEAQENKAREVSKSEGEAETRAKYLADIKINLDAALATLAARPAIDLAPIKAKWDAAYERWSKHYNTTSEMTNELEDLKVKRMAFNSGLRDAQQRLDFAKLRVEEYRADIENISFNNTLLKKMRVLKPLITDNLWNTVLAAVSSFFTQLRGENSVVTKDSGGFKVNGKSIQSLSGSTLDVLALAVRVALTKTFIPNSSLLILDEPAHGCDVDRTSSMLGFLSSVGFDQILVASHDELSESVADNVISLGA